MVGATTYCIVSHFIIKITRLFYGCVTKQNCHKFASHDTHHIPKNFLKLFQNLVRVGPQNDHSGQKLYQAGIALNPRKFPNYFGIFAE